MITNSCLKYLQALTTNLQAEAMDIVEAVQEVSSVKQALHNARSNIDTCHNHWFRTVEQMCSDIGVETSLPRRCGRQIHRNNIPAETPSVYYCRCVSIPLLDHLISEIESRFSTQQQTALLGFSRRRNSVSTDRLVYQRPCYRRFNTPPQCFPTYEH